MILGRVTGALHATLANQHLEGQHLLLVDPVEPSGKLSGKPLVCIDRVGAGPGDLVLVNREGGAARALLQDDRSPVQALIVGVVDHMQVKE